MTMRKKREALVAAGATALLVAMMMAVTEVVETALKNAVKTALKVTKRMIVRMNSLTVSLQEFDRPSTNGHTPTSIGTRSF